MKKFIISTIYFMVIGTTFATDGVLNVSSAQIAPAPLDALENNGTGVYSFDVKEFAASPVPPAPTPAKITISLSNIDLIDGVNSVEGYSTYFSISLAEVEGNPNIYLEQKTTIPADEFMTITLDIKVTANTSQENANNGGVVKITAGSGQPPSTLDNTEIFTYTKAPEITVSVTDFIATPTFSGVELGWTTNSEIENIEFIVERKVGDAGEWVEIYKINGVGAGNSPTDYSYKDESISANTTYSYRLSYKNSNGDVTILSLNDVVVVTLDITTSSMVEQFTVLPAYPNPFNPTTTIRYGLDSENNVKIQIYNILGKLITTLVNQNQSQGWHEIHWNGTNQHGEIVPAGIYMSRVISGNNIKTNKLLLLK